MDHQANPECELIHEGGLKSKDLMESCTKHPGHAAFIPITQFSLKHLPPDCRTQEIMEFIRRMSDRTVKVSVSYTSPGRPITYPDGISPYPYSKYAGLSHLFRVGTGIIRYVIHSPVTDQACPCVPCKTAAEPAKKFWNVVVITSTHVIYDDSEAAHSIFECFYESEDNTDVRCLYGQGIRDNPTINPFTDRCSVTCVTHDADLVDKLVELQVRWRGMYQISLKGLTCGVIISHPHGCTKRISLGKILHTYLQITPLFPCKESHRFGKNLKCRQVAATDADVLQSAPLLDPSIEELPYGTTFTLADKAMYLCRARKCGLDFWMTFPPGTRFTSPDGEDLPLLAETTEFYCEKMDYYMKHEGMYYLTYDIPTCPGSSGAEIFHYDELHMRSFLSHAGTLNNGTNKSSLSICLR